jgi:hypothetical protein
MRFFGGDKIPKLFDSSLTMPAPPPADLNIIAAAPEMRDLSYINSFGNKRLDYDTLFDDREWLGSLFITFPIFYLLAIKLFGAGMHSLFWYLLLTQLWVPIFFAFGVFLIWLTHNCLGFYEHKIDVHKYFEIVRNLY